MFLKPVIFLFLAILVLNVGPGLMAPSGRKTNDNFCTVVDSDKKFIGNPRNADYRRKIWPHKILYYESHQSFSKEEKEAVRRSLQTINECTCLTFIEMKGSAQDQPDVMYFPSDDGSYTFIGFSPTRIPHPVYLDEVYRKNTKVILHETFHVLGRYHEQSRHDRDEYVYIEEDNIINWEKYGPNFQKSEDTTLSKLPYDYKSIMHYGKNAFGGGEITIYAKENDRLVERDFGSEKPTLSDWKKINLLYKCNMEIPKKCE
ncbi:hypothetical protein KR067_008958 [Drosophila pandora]|nr:hypothetical protein KR067_008958 [Drosophila pandora]